MLRKLQEIMYVPLVGEGRMDPRDGLVVVHLAHQIRLIPGDDNWYILLCWRES